MYKLFLQTFREAEPACWNKSSRSKVSTKNTMFALSQHPTLSYVASSQIWIENVSFCYSLFPKKLVFLLFSLSSLFPSFLASNESEAEEDEVERPTRKTKKGRKKTPKFKKVCRIISHDFTNWIFLVQPMFNGSEGRCSWNGKSCGDSSPY